MIRHAGRIAALVAVVVTIAACGETRFVVVENEPVAAAPTAAGGTTGAGSTAPRPATDAELTEMRELVGFVFSDGAVPMDERLARVVDSDDLGPTAQTVLDLVKATGADVTVDSATVSGDTATATVSVEVGGEPFASDLPVDLVLVDDEWKVTRGGACAVLSLGSPCPDAPAK